MTSPASCNYTKSPCTSWSSDATFPDTLQTNTEDDIYIDGTMSTLNRACKEVLR